MSDERRDERLHAALLVVGLAAGLAFLALRAQPAGALQVGLKALPLVLMMVAVGRVAARGVFERLVLLGLGLSLLGDVVLEIDGKGLFVPGLVCFLLGHLAYIGAFTHDDRALRPGVGLAFAGYGALAMAVLGPHLGDLLAPVAVYVAVICAMMWRAVARVRAGSSLPVWAGAIGAVCFGLSDTTLAIDKFHTPFEAAPLLIMATYWLGQLGIAATAIGGAQRMTAIGSSARQNASLRGK